MLNFVAIRKGINGCLSRHQWLTDSWIFEPRIFELSTLNPDIWTLGEKGIFEPQTFELCIFEPVSFEPCIFEPLVEDEFLNPAFLNP